MQRQPIGLFLALSLLLAVGRLSLAHAQEATVTPVFDVAESLSPIALLDALLATSFPDDLLPDGVAPLRAYDWRDANDPDLSGSIGAVIYADGDPFGPQPTATITYMVYPDANGPRAAMAPVLQYGDAVELRFDGQILPAAKVALQGATGQFVAVDNVLVFGMALAGDDADKTAGLLARAGIAHLLQVAAADSPGATPVASAASSGEAAFLDVAAAPYPDERIPFDTGPLVVLPMPTSSEESSGGLVGGLVVRDADRTYPYPLATYQFYADEAAARDVASSAVSGAGEPTRVALPSDIDIPFPTDIIHRADGTTTVLVQVGSTIVSVDVSRGDMEERRATALKLAQIAVDHLQAVTEIADG